MLAVVLGLLGLALGPWLGVVVDRVVEREPFAATHRCARCGTDLGGRATLVPVASWFRRCPDGHPGWRYPLTDIATAVGFAALAWRFGAVWQLWPYLALTAVLVVLAVVDLETHLLPDVLTLRLLPAAAFAVVVLSGLNDAQELIAPAFAAAAAWGLMFFVAWFAYPPGLGFGDVKLVPTLGLALGWLHTGIADGVSAAFQGALVALLASALVGLPYRWWANRQPEERFAHQPDDWIPGEVPLGPFLVVATLVLVVVGGPAEVVR